MATADILDFSAKKSSSANGLPLPDLDNFVAWLRRHHAGQYLQVSQLVSLADEWSFLVSCGSIGERDLVRHLSQAGITKRRLPADRTPAVIAREAGRKARRRTMDHSDLVPLKEETGRSIMQTVYRFTRFTEL